MNWYFEVLKKYAVFDGRAHRTEFWLFFLFNFIISFFLGVIVGLVGSLWFITTLYALAVLIPGLAVSARRLHDTNRSGWWILTGLVPILGWIALLIFYVEDSRPGANQYGPESQGRPGHTANSNSGRATPATRAFTFSRHHHVAGVRRTTPGYHL